MVYNILLHKCSLTFWLFCCVVCVVVIAFKFVKKSHPGHLNLIMHVILKPVEDLNVSESLLREKQKDL